jgi:hypothetical protein
MIDETVTIATWPKGVTRPKLATVSIFNEYDMLKKGEAVVRWYPYRRHTPGGNSWHVGVKGTHLPDTPWYNHGAKSFTAHGASSKADALTAALQWAANYTGVSTWVKTPWGSYIPQTAAWRAAVRVKAARRTPPKPTRDGAR